MNANVAMYQVSASVNLGRATHSRDTDGSLYEAIGQQLLDRGVVLSDYYTPTELRAALAATTSATRKGSSENDGSSLQVACGDGYHDYDLSYATCVWRGPVAILQLNLCRVALLGLGRELRQDNSGRHYVAVVEERGVRLGNIPDFVFDDMGGDYPSQYAAPPMARPPVKAPAKAPVEVVPPRAVSLQPGSRRRRLRSSPTEALADES